MKKIDGEIIVTKTEVGAKYIADDGTEFSNEFDCSRYEKRVENAKKKCIFDEYMEDLEAHHLVLNTFDTFDTDGRMLYYQKFETKDEFLKFIDVLKNYDKVSYINYSVYLEGFTKDMLTFPTTLAISKVESYSDDGPDSCEFDIYEMKSIKDQLIADLATVSAFLEEKIMKNLKIDGFVLVTNLIPKVEQVTYDMVGREENDYFDITVPSNKEDTLVLSFYKDCELTAVYVAIKDNLEAVAREGIKEVWGL